MHHFEHRDGHMFCEGVSLASIAEAVGTPTYVYSHATLERHHRVFTEAFASRKHLICFSVKANSNLAVLASLFSWGAGADIVSGGELFRALRAGGSPAKIVFSGVGKRAEEIEAALSAGVLAFNVESEPELELIAQVAARVGKIAPISVRVNPDVDAGTHPYISTGLKQNKFGLSIERSRALYRRAGTMEHVAVKGIDCHIGSQLLEVAPVKDAISRVAELAHDLAEEGLELELLDVGGGLGIPYREDEAPPAPEEYARAVLEAVKPFDSLDLTLVFEPGRVIAGNAGVLLSSVLYRKRGQDKQFVITDAAMNDLMRPALYQSYHRIVPVTEHPGESFVADVVGPICETGDFFARDRTMPPVEAGDLVAIMSAGAYGFTMSSNYNTRPRAAEVLVRGDRYHVIRRREVLEDLVRGESIPDWARGHQESPCRS